MIKHEDRVLKDIIRGQTPEKKIQTGWVPGKKEKEEKDAEQKRIRDKLDATKDLRRPWFCPECKRVMKTHADDRMWTLRGKCHNCVVEEEHKMRVDGTFEEYEKQKIEENKRAWFSDMKARAESYIRNVNNKNVIENDFGDLAEFSEVDIEKAQIEIDKYFEHLEKQLFGEKDESTETTE